jgi:ABC-type glycerol-3-phosphate transport system substrate-binding protein
MRGRQDIGAWGVWRCVATAAAAGACVVAALGATPAARAGTLDRPLPNGSRDPRQLVVWHTQDHDQAVLLGQLVEAFTAASGVRVSLETGVNLETTLLTQMEDATLPDAVLAPSDLISLRRELRMSAVPRELLPASLDPAALASVTSDGAAWGVPLLDGNVLLLLYDKARIAAAPTTWEELIALAARPSPLAHATAPDAARGLVAMGLENTYVFLPFFAAFGGWPLTGDAVTLDTAACREALAYERKLRDAGVAPRDCGYDCTTTRFYAGDYALAINGDWALGEARRALGARLGVAPLPRAGERALASPRATHALLFPGDALRGPKGPA